MVRWFCKSLLRVYIHIRLMEASASKEHGLVEELGRVLHYLIHRKSIMQYFHELRYTRDKISFMELAARALLEARRDKDSGEASLRIPNGNDVVDEVSRMGDNEFREFVKKLLMLAAGRDPACEKCREGGG
jgi:hypothetical protein